MIFLYRCLWKYLDNRYGLCFLNRLYLKSMFWCYEKVVNNIDVGFESILLIL